MSVNPVQRRSCGLTLTEVLVVLTILSALAVGVAPNVSAWLSNAGMQERRNKLENSWRMARILALASQRPVLWELQTKLRQITIAGSGAGAKIETLWSASLGNGQINLLLPTSPEPHEDLYKVIVEPHGLTDTLELELVTGSQTEHVTLPGVWKESTDFIISEPAAIGGS